MPRGHEVAAVVVAAARRAEEASGAEGADLVAAGEAALGEAPQGEEASVEVIYLY